MPCVCGLEGVLVEGFLSVYHFSSFLVVCCVEYQTLVGLRKSQLLSVSEWKQLESKHEKGRANVRRVISTRLTTAHGSLVCSTLESEPAVPWCPYKTHTNRNTLIVLRVSSMVMPVSSSKTAEQDTRGALVAFSSHARIFWGRVDNSFPPPLFFNGDQLAHT